MQPTSIRVPLSIGMSGAAKAIATAGALVLIIGSTFFAAVALGIGSMADWMSSTADDPFGGNPVFPDEPGFETPDMPDVSAPFDFFKFVATAMAFLGIPFIVGGLYLLVYTWRHGAWLTGTVVAKRGALLTRRADLATAEVSMGGVNYTQHHQHGVHDHRTIIRLPALVVTDPGTGKTLKIPLRGNGLDLLPPYQLEALASALEANTSAGAQRARAIGAHLRSVAGDPLAA
ncbi:MAG: hypothetical protein HOU81_12705 [Hamadaea sp.]|uniref:hypothetical protein n=1 Tax=Hamadaea sp. TaxID=2024425 RepID=UPI0017B35C5F|nr:hypothetical protein [Hamadaea sp.]NUR71674.1 hypothetical protein [Hamadaea sp.]NUT18166.1 hypothetical protein [Hamadaea sp.]